MNRFRKLFRRSITYCAHCQVEREGKPRQGISHGICRRHYRQMLEDYTAKEQWNVLFLKLSRPFESYVKEAAKTYKDLRPMRNDNLDSSFAERLEAENIGWRTCWMCIGIGITAAAAAVGAVLVMTL